MNTNIEITKNDINKNEWNASDHWGDDFDNNESQKDNLDKIKEKIFNFDGNDNNDDVFEEDDFIFKQCYI